jgi:hypothetical protein
MMFSPGNDKAESESITEDCIGQTSPDQNLVLMIESQKTSPKIVDAQNMLDLITIQGYPKDDEDSWESILWGDTTFLSCDKFVQSITTDDKNNPYFVVTDLNQGEWTRTHTY